MLVPFGKKVIDGCILVNQVLRLKVDFHLPQAVHCRINQTSVRKDGK